MTVTEVRGFGLQEGHTELDRGAEYVVDFLPKLKLEIAVPQDRVEEVVDAIAGSAVSSRIGDGKIFVHDLETALRIRNGEQGDEIVDIEKEPEEVYAEHCRQADIASAPLRDCLSYYNGHGDAEPGSLAYYGGGRWHKFRIAAQDSLEPYVFGH